MAADTQLKGTPRELVRALHTLLSIGVPVHVELEQPKQGDGDARRLTVYSANQDRYGVLFRLFGDMESGGSSGPGPLESDDVRSIAAALDELEKSIPAIKPVPVYIPPDMPLA